jgi:hypothetical protein
LEIRVRGRGEEGFKNEPESTEKEMRRIKKYTGIKKSTHEGLRKVKEDGGRMEESMLC